MQTVPVHRLLSEAVSCLQTSSSSVTPTRSELTPTPTTSISLEIHRAGFKVKERGIPFSISEARDWVVNLQVWAWRKRSGLCGTMSSTAPTKTKFQLQCRLISAGSCNSFLAMACFNYKYWALSLKMNICILSLKNHNSCTMYWKVSPRRQFIAYNGIAWCMLQIAYNRNLLPEVDPSGNWKIKGFTKENYH